MAFTAQDLIRLSLMEIRSARAGDSVNPNDNADALLILNGYLDLLNITNRALYDTTQTTFTMTSGLQPHTIGLTANSPTFSVSINRPARILSANIVLSGNIRLKVNVLNDQEWDAITAGAAAGQSATITSSIPTDLNYRPAWPNGNLFLWPVPTANKLELRFETLLASLALTDTLTLPMGYQEMLRLTLAERLASAWGQTVAASTKQLAREAREAVWGANDISLDAIPDVGMTTAASRGGWNFRTGQISQR